MTARVLIVDDSMFMRGALGHMLTDNGHVVVGEAENGIEAIEKYRQLKPDIVTLDITMPDMTGLNALRAIKEIDPEAKIIMCSAMGQNSMVMDALEHGAADFIIKPFKESRVMEAIERALTK